MGEGVSSGNAQVKNNANRFLGLILIYAIPRVRSSYKLKPVKFLLIIYTFKRQTNEFPPRAGLLKAPFRKGKKKGVKR